MISLADEEISRKQLEEISSDVLDLVQFLYTGCRTVLLYPSESPAVQRAVENVYQSLMPMIPEGGALDLSFMEDKLVVNGEVADDFIQKKGITKKFQELMKNRKISSATFWSGLEKEELREFMGILGTKAPTLGAEESADLDSILEEKGIKHVEVDEQIYVAISKREKVVSAAAAVEHEEDATLKALKDEVFTRFLAGEISLGEVGEEAIKDITSDPEKMASMLQSVVSAKGWDSGVEVLPYRVEETRAILERVSELIENVEDPLLAAKLNREIGKIASQMETPELSEILLKSGEVEMGDRLAKLLLPAMSDEKLSGLMESLVAEYKGIKGTQEEGGWPTKRMLALQSLIEEAASGAQSGPAGETADLGEAIAIVGESPEREAEISGGELAKLLVSGAGVDVCDNFSGPALVGAAKRLFEDGNDELGSNVMGKAMERFRAQGHESKQVAAEQIWSFFQRMREIGKEAYMADFVDEVSRVLEETKTAESTLETLSEKVEELSGPSAEALGVSPTLVNKLMSSDAGKVVQAVFSAGDEKAQEAVARVLLEMEDKGIPALVETATNATDEKILDSVAASLKEMKSDPVPQIARVMAQELEPYQVVNLVKLLGMVGSETSASILNSLLVEEDPDIREAVIEAFGRLGGKQALQNLLAESAGLDPKLKAAAVRELGNFKDYFAVRRLMEIISPKKKGEIPEEKQVMMAACRSLGKLGVREAAPTLARIAMGEKPYRDSPEEVRAVAVEALGKIGGEEADKTLKKLLKCESLLIRNAVRRALAG